MFTSNDQGSLKFQICREGKLQVDAYKHNRTPVTHISYSHNRIKQKHDRERGVFLGVGGEGVTVSGGCWLMQCWLWLLLPKKLVGLSVTAES